MNDNDGKPGLRIESASSVIAADLMRQYMSTFAHVVRQDRVAGKAVHAEFVSGLAGICALLIVGGQGSRDDIMQGTISKLREYIDRDLHHLARR